MIPFSYNVRNLAVRKTTTAAAAMGLALVVFVVAAVNMLNNGIKKTLGRAADPAGAIVLRKGADAELASNIDEPQVGLVLATPGVAHTADGAPDGIAELIGVILLDKVGTDGFSNVQVRGVTDSVLKFRKDTRIIAGRAAQPGTDEVVIGRGIRGRFKGVELGQSFELKKNRNVSVVGVFEDGASSFESEVWVDLNTFRTAFGREGLVSSVRARLESPSKYEGFKASVESNRQLGLEVFRESEYYDKQSSGLSIFISALGFIIAFFFGVGAVIGAMITMYASVANRQREIGTLRALGFTKFSIVTSFMFESVLLALVGGLVGATASLLLGLVKFSMMNFTSWSEIVIAFEPNMASIGGALVVAGVMGVVGGLFPAIRAARMSPIQAMRA
ncbi:MAG TPA: ABC transporter permease [Polyangiaceae bacterium]|nr:ABC transporter permease [Polyangiaceae bacterium]